MNDDLLARLKASHLVTSDQARLEPLPGGVSSDIHLVHDGERKFVVKQALEKLKVEADWFADTSRNEAERQYIEYVNRIRPGSAPQLISAGDGYFAMEYLDEGFVNWKQAMLDGRFEEDWASRAGSLIGQVHQASQSDQQLAGRFSNMESFRQLRIEPYLVTTGAKHPDLRERFNEEAERLKTDCFALVHGDFSPKNILVSEDRLVLLDCEVACYADPAFDLAFLFTHLFLKVLYHKNHYQEVKDMLEGFCEAYGGLHAELEKRAGRLHLMLLFARVDGKSPVEYLTRESDKQLVRNFCRESLLADSFALQRNYENWVAAIRGAAS